MKAFRIGALNVIQTFKHSLISYPVGPVLIITHIKILKRI